MCDTPQFQSLNDEFQSLKYTGSKFEIQCVIPSFEIHRWTQRSCEIPSISKFEWWISKFEIHRFKV